MDYDTFRSNVCHQVAMLGELDFIFDAISNHIILQFWEEKKQFQALYLLGMIDYLCRKNDVPKCENYNELRAFRFEKPIYPRDVLLASRLGVNEIKEKVMQEAIPEFLRFNIVEFNIEDVT